MVATRRTDRDSRAERAESPAGDDSAERDDEETAEAYPDEEPEAGESARRRPAKRRSGGLTAVSAAQEGLRVISEVTGKKAEGVTSVEPTDDGWAVEVEVIEDSRIPSSTDVIGLYEVEVDADGSLRSYRRTQRYSRGHGSEAS